VQVDVDPETPLLWVIREELGLTGTKYGCGMALCGACTVHLDGEAIRSCVATCAAGSGQASDDDRGFVEGSEPSLQRAWIEIDVPQCGYASPGKIMSAACCWRKTETD